MDHKLAMKVWHWPFLAQKEPMPEMLIDKGSDRIYRLQDGELDQGERPVRLRSARARALPRFLLRSAAHPRDLRGLPRRRRPPISATTRPTAPPARRSSRRCSRCGAPRASRARAARSTIWKRLGDRRDRQADRFRPFPRRGKSRTRRRRAHARILSKPCASPPVIAAKGSAARFSWRRSSLPQRRLLAGAAHDRQEARGRASLLRESRFRGLA